MIVGEIYEAPWGRYVVHRTGVLRSLDAPNAFIVGPGEAYKRTGESIAPIAPIGAGARMVALAREHQVITADELPAVLAAIDREEHVVGLEVAVADAGTPAHTEPELEPRLTLGGFRPGVPLWLLPHKEQLWWKPCIRRGENGDTHVWYLASTREGTLLCHSCRVGAPRVVIGPKEWIAEIREAMDEGDIERTSKLLARGAA